MARAPTLDNFSISPQAGGMGRVSAPPIENQGGRQLQQLGGAIQGAAQVAQKIEMDQLEEANRLRVTDAINRAKEAATRLTFDKDQGFTQKRGIDALERPGGKTLTDEYSEQLGSTLDEIMGSLGNDAQRQAFQQSGRGLVAGFRSDITRHEADEFTTYATSVDEGATTNAINQMGMFWNDPDRVQEGVDTIRSSTDRLRRRMGKSAEWGEARTRELLSQGHTAAIATAIEKDDVSYAEKYLDLHREQMTAQDVLRVDGLIGKEQDARISLQAADEIFSGGQRPSYAPADPPQFAMPVRGQVTSGFGSRRAPTAGASTNHNGVDIAVPIGTPVSAPAGGEVIASGFDSANGNFIKVRHADGTVTGYAHLSTREVKKDDRIAAGQVFAKSGNTGRVTGKGHLHYTMTAPDGSKVDPTKPRSTGQTAQGSSGASLLDMIQALGRDPRLAGNPERLQQAEQRVRSLYAAREEGEREVKEQTQMAVWEKLYSNGGNITGLTAAERQGLGPNGLSAAMSFANQVQAERQPKYQPDDMLWGQLKASPESLAAMSPAELARLRPRLGSSNYKDLVTDREALFKKDPVKLNSAKTLQQGVNFMKAELAAAGIDTTPKPGSKEAKDYAQFQATYIRAIQAEEGTTGKPLTPDRARQVGLGLIREQVVNDGWIWDTKKKVYQGEGALPRYQDIPKQINNELVRMLQRSSPPGTRITQGMIVQEYARYLQER